MLKFILDYENTACYGGIISGFTSISAPLWPRNLGKTRQQWLQCVQGGGIGQLLHAYILIQACMHANSNTEA